MENNHSSFLFGNKYFCFMCISATASFIASGILATAGAAVIMKAIDPSIRLFAAIPLLFAIQQFTEGLVWLSINNASSIVVTSTSIYFFLFFALILWPVFLPLSVFLLEKNKMRKRVLFLFLLMGGLISLFMIYVMFFRNISAQAMFLHVHYNVDYPYNLPFISILPYFVATAIPQFISSVGKMKWFGIAIVISFIITNIYFKETVPSVWCFFAALSSTIIILIVNKSARTAPN